MFDNLKIKFLKSVKSKKLNVFVFFLFLSFAFLVIAKLSKPYTETIAFHIEYMNVPEQHSIEPNTDSIIKVRVKGYGFNLISHNFYRHTLKVDFNKEVQKKGQKYIWSTKKGRSKLDSQLGSKIEIISIQPDSLVFPYEIMMVKKVPIKLDLEITYAAGYDLLDSLRLKPDSVKVIGPKNRIEKISKVITEKLKLKEINSSINKDVKLKLDKKLENIKLNYKTTKVLGTVEKFTEGTFEVPVTIVNLPADLKINYFPKTVAVSYIVSLQNYKKIKALDFKVICDYAEMDNSERTFFSPQLAVKPKLVKSAKIKQNKVEFIILK